MKKRGLSIRNKILGSFLLLVAIFSVNAILSIFTLKKSKNIIQTNAEVVAPSVSAIKDFKQLATKSRMLIANWVYQQNSNKDKEELKELHQFEYPKHKQKLAELSELWESKGESMLLDSILHNFDSLLYAQQSIMTILTSFESYEDITTKFTAEETLESEILPIYSTLIRQLETATELKEAQAKKADNSLLNSFKNLETIIISLGLIIFSIGIIGAFLMARSITRPINYLKEIILDLGKGKLRKKNNRNFSNDEIGEIAEAVDTLLNGLKLTSEFAENIGKGNYAAKFKPLSDEDVLGNALIEMRDNLQQISKEDNKRNWTTEGLASFGEILRKNNDNLNKLANKVTISLVKYLKANQGSIFLVSSEDQDDPYLYLLSCYAWDKEKHLDQKIYKGDGLTGQCWIEGSTIYVTDVPDDYIKITSGLGDANPTSILIVPLKVNESVYGIIEIASFNLFEKHEIEFVEKLGESIASTISTVKINERTQVLLTESRQMTEEMRAQEEEMRQNMEELQATQEEMQRNYLQTQAKDKIINACSIVLELNEELNIVNVNSQLEKELQLNQSDLQNKSIKALIPDESMLKQMTDYLKDNKTWSGIVKLINKDEDEMLFNIIAGAINNDSETKKYLIFATKIVNNTGTKIAI